MGEPEVIGRLRSAVEGAIDAAAGEPGRRWLEAAIARIGEQPRHIRVAFPAAGRMCGRGALHAPLQGPLLGAEPYGWTVDDGARALLLAALSQAIGPQAAGPLAEEARYLYEHGDAAERRGVLRALPLLPVGPAALPLVRDALRTNDTRLISAALGPYAADHLDDHDYRHGVLKCVFTGIPLASVAGLERRAGHELARMLADYARELAAAGRDVPADIGPLIDAYPEVGAP
jgi:hypothetical protein